MEAIITALPPNDFDFVKGVRLSSFDSNTTFLVSVLLSTILRAEKYHLMTYRL